MQRKQNLFSRDKTGDPEWASSGSQSKRRIRFILRMPTSGASLRTTLEQILIYRIYSAIIKFWTLGVGAY